MLYSWLLEELDDFEISFILLENEGEANRIDLLFPCPTFIISDLINFSSRQFEAISETPSKMDLNLYK